MSESIVSQFIEAINQQDVNRIFELISEDHVFINSHGKSTSGKQNMKQAWKSYFDFFPDYTIEVTEVIESEGVVGVFGWASATYMNKRNKQDSNYWRLPCAWKGVVANKKLRVWQVFSDTKIPYEIIEKNLK